MYLDKKLNSTNHNKEKNSKKQTKKEDKVIDIKRELYDVLPRHSVIVIYKPSTGPPPDYGAIIFDQLKNVFFCKEIESAQYNDM